MEIINISKKKLDSLEPFTLPKNVISTECELFKFRYRGVDRLVKKLFNNDGLVFANKLYTLQAISANLDYIPEYFVTPDFLLSINKSIEAFVMPILNGINISIILNEKESNVSLEEKKYYLKRIGVILEQMKNIRKYTPLTDFYLGDLHEDNFLVDPSKVDLSVVDVDSIKIAGNKTSPSKYLTPFGLLSVVSGKYKERDNDSFGAYEADENTDLYCYNIIVLNFLFGSSINNIEITEFYKFINYLNDLGVDKNLLESFNRIVCNSNNINPMNYIDSLTHKQIYKARSREYK